MISRTFRFQTGSIKSLDAHNQHNVEFSFDSKLVRLKVNEYHEAKLEHYRFDSKLVRLKVVSVLRILLQI